MACAVLWLESDDCLEPARVGDKAARLAMALRRGLPVPAGLVIPTEVSDALLATAAQAVAREGVHAARLSVMDAVVPDLECLTGEVSALGGDLVVRSSSPLEADPAYAGAFASYLGVDTAEVATAVRGVWASALLDGAGRADESADAARGITPRMAVLVQAQVEPRFSGTAQVGHDAAVMVVVVSGSPAPLLSGWMRGEVAMVSPAGDVSGEAATALAGATTLADVAALARRVRDEIGDDLIEWATTENGLALLQAKRASRRQAAAPVVGGRAVPPAAAGVARMVHAFAGSLGEALVLPLVLAGIRPNSAVPAARAPGAAVTRSAAVDAWSRARTLSRGLLGGSGVPGTPRPNDPGSMVAQLRRGSLAEAVENLARVPPVDVTELIDCLDTVARWLVQSGRLSAADHLWAVSPSEVGELIAGASRPASSDSRECRRLALLGWEPLVYLAVTATGESVEGEPAAGGVGAGPAVVITGLPTAAGSRARMVVVAPNPIPQLAPLLWGAAGLVTSGGGTAAHLIEVARSRGVPAVVGCNAARLFSLLDSAGGAPALVAVDGDSGRVAVDVPP